MTTLAVLCNGNNNVIMTMFSSTCITHMLFVFTW